MSYRIFTYLNRLSDDIYISDKLENNTLFTQEINEMYFIDINPKDTLKDYLKSKPVSIAIAEKTKALRPPQNTPFYLVIKKEEGSLLLGYVVYATTDKNLAKEILKKDSTVYIKKISGLPYGIPPIPHFSKDKLASLKEEEILNWIERCKKIEKLAIAKLKKRTSRLPYGLPAIKNLSKEYIASLSNEKILDWIERCKEKIRKRPLLLKSIRTSIFTLQTALNALRHTVPTREVETVYVYNSLSDPFISTERIDIQEDGYFTVPKNQTVDTLEYDQYLQIGVLVSQFTLRDVQFNPFPAMVPEKYGVYKVYKDTTGKDKKSLMYITPSLEVAKHLSKTMLLTGYKSVFEKLNLPKGNVPYINFDVIGRRGIPFSKKTMVNAYLTYSKGLAENRYSEPQKYRRELHYLEKVIRGWKDPKEYNCVYPKLDKYTGGSYTAHLSIVASCIFNNIPIEAGIAVWNKTISDAKLSEMKVLLKDPKVNHKKLMMYCYNKIALTLKKYTYCSTSNNMIADLFFTQACNCACGTMLFESIAQYLKIKNVLSLAVPGHILNIIIDKTGVFEFESTQAFHQSLAYYYQPPKNRDKNQIEPTPLSKSVSSIWDFMGSLQLKWKGNLVVLVDAWKSIFNNKQLYSFFDWILNILENQSNWRKMELIYSAKISTVEDFLETNSILTSMYDILAKTVDVGVFLQREGNSAFAIKMIDFQEQSNLLYKHYFIDHPELLIKGLNKDPLGTYKYSVLSTIPITDFIKPGNPVYKYL